MSSVWSCACRAINIPKKKLTTVNNRAVNYWVQCKKCQFGQHFTTGNTNSWSTQQMQPTRTRAAINHFSLFQSKFQYQLWKLVLTNSFWAHPQESASTFRCKLQITKTWNFRNGKISGDSSDKTVLELLQTKNVCLFLSNRVVYTKKCSVL